MWFFVKCLLFALILSNFESENPLEFEYHQTISISFPHFSLIVISLAPLDDIKSQAHFKCKPNIIDTIYYIALFIA